ncbi:hypothetical protein BaRGS_00028625, partial [Batillaria attramentaria]
AGCVRADLRVGSIEEARQHQHTMTSSLQCAECELEICLVKEGRVSVVRNVSG